MVLAARDDVVLKMCTDKMPGLDPGGGRWWVIVRRRVEVEAIYVIVTINVWQGACTHKNWVWSGYIVVQEMWLERIVAVAGFLLTMRAQKSAQKWRCA